MKKEILERIEKTIKFMPRIEVIRLSKKDYDDFLRHLEKEQYRIYGHWTQSGYKNMEEFNYKGVAIKHV